MRDTRRAKDLWVPAPASLDMNSSAVSGTRSTALGLSSTGSQLQRPISLTVDPSMSNTDSSALLSSSSSPHDSWRSILSMSPISSTHVRSSDLYLSPTGISVGLKSEDSEDDSDPTWYRAQVDARRRSQALDIAETDEEISQPLGHRNTADIFIHPGRPWSTSCVGGSGSAGGTPLMCDSSMTVWQTRDTEDRTSWPSSSNDPTQGNDNTPDIAGQGVATIPTQPVSFQSHLVMQDDQSLAEVACTDCQTDAEQLGIRFCMLKSQREYVLEFFLPGFSLDGIALTTKGFNKRTLHLIANRWDAEGSVQFDRRITFSADASLTAIRARFENETLRVTVPRKLA